MCGTGSMHVESSLSLPNPILGGKIQVLNNLNNGYDVNYL